MIHVFFTSCCVRDCAFTFKGLIENLVRLWRIGYDDTLNPCDLKAKFYVMFSVITKMLNMCILFQKYCRFSFAFTFLVPSCDGDRIVVYEQQKLTTYLSAIQLSSFLGYASAVADF